MCKYQAEHIEWHIQQHSQIIHGHLFCFKSLQQQHSKCIWYEEIDNFVVVVLLLHFCSMESGREREREQKRKKPTLQMMIRISKLKSGPSAGIRSERSLQRTHVNNNVEKEMYYLPLYYVLMIFLFFVKNKREKNGETFTLD